MRAASAIVGEPLSSVERLHGGRNNRTFRAVGNGPGEYAIKVYFQHPDDARDRLGTEFRAAAFMWRHGLRQIPEPVGSDPARGIAVYEFVGGDPIVGVADQDIAAAVEFLGALRSLASEADAAELPDASEACFSAQVLVQSIEGRLDRLRSLPRNLGEYRDLHLFLDETISPALRHFVDRCRARYADAGIGCEAEIAAGERTLSPSDFGFHNSLRRLGGDIVFLDFEYFGWDDPAKTISDFLLHPAMSLSAGLKRRFLSGALERLDRSGQVAARLGGVYPLWGLKWSLIILNEFLAEHSDRRRFALGVAEAGCRRRVEQLDKARRLVSGFTAISPTGDVEDWMS